MALIALLLASEEVEDGSGGLRAALPIAGVPLLERQAERAIAAGARKILVFVRMLPQSVTQVLDHLNAGGVPARPVRTIVEILAELQPDDRLLLIADAVHAATGQYRAMAHTTAPAVLAAPDGPTTLPFERIDAAARWGGLAVLPHQLVAENARIPADWDIGSTLLRSAVQAGAHRIAVDPTLFERGEIAVVADAATAQAVETRLLQNTPFSGGGMGQSLFFAPLARLIGPSLLRQNVTTPVLSGMAILMMVVSLGLLAKGTALAGGLVGLMAALGAALARFQQSVKKLNAMDKKLSQIFDIALFLAPLALVFSDVMPATRADIADVGVISAVAMSLIALWVFARFAPRLGNQAAQGVKGLLPDPEWLLLLVSGCAALGYGSAALPIALVFAVTGLLLWLRTAVKRA